MEKMTLSPLRLKNRWGLTALSVALCLLLAPLAAMCMALPQAGALIPAIALMLLGYAGPVSACACSAILMGVCGAVYGGYGAIFAALLMLPVLAAAAFTLRREIAFFPSAGLCAGVLFASMGAMMLAVSLATGSDVVTALTEALRGVYEGLGDLLDPLLVLIAQAGALALPEGVSLDAIAQGAHLPPQAREEMLSSMLYVLNVGLRYEMPMQMTTGAMLSGLLGQAMLRRGLRRRGEPVAYPPLRTWMLPKGWGRVLGITYAALYLLSMLLPERMGVMAYVFGGVFTVVFAVQGVAAVCYLLHSRGRGRGWQAAVFVLGALLLRSVAMFVGIADQAFDFTHRREALAEGNNPYDPRARM